MGTGGHSSPSPPLRALHRRPRCPASPPAGASEPDPGRTVADRPERGCHLRALNGLRSGRSGLRTREFAAARPPPARPLPASRPARPLAQPLPGAHLPQPSGSWTGPLQLRVAWDSGPRLRESETSLLASHKIRARPKQQGLDQVPYLSGPPFSHSRNRRNTPGCVRMEGAQGRSLCSTLTKSCFAFWFSGRSFYLSSYIHQIQALAQCLAQRRWLLCLWNE